MKKITFILLLSMVTMLSANANPPVKFNVQVTISIQTFYDELSPYGDWIYTQDFGYVWRPYFDNPAAFRPYSSGGHWVNTSYGWTWVSDYRWGWATFHYGRWNFDNYLGWTWIPGYEWAPAWVTWGQYDDYWGWAPMGPNIYVQTNWFAPDPWWTFVPRRHFCSNNWNRYIYNRPVRVTNITHITNIYIDNNHSRDNRNTWYNGPRVSDVERYSRQRVRTVEVVDSPRADNTGISNNRLNVYRPAVNNNRSESRPADYRNADQARFSTRIEQNNARVNNPGAVRTRSTDDSRNQMKQQPVPNNGTRQGTDVRTSPQPNPRNSAVNQDTKSEPRMAPQVYPSRNTSPQQPPQYQNTRQGNTRSTETTTPATNPVRNDNPGNTQPRNSSPDLNRVYSSPARDQRNTPQPAVQPNRQQNPQPAAPAVRTRTEKQEKKQVIREEKRQNERRNAVEREKGSDPNPPRR